MYIKAFTKLSPPPPPGACGLHRLSNAYKLDNISGQIVPILLICAKILLIHVQETNDMH